MKLNVYTMERATLEVLTNIMKAHIGLENLSFQYAGTNQKALNELSEIEERLNTFWNSILSEEDQKTIANQI